MENFINNQLPLPLWANPLFLNGPFNVQTLQALHFFNNPLITPILLPGGFNSFNAYQAFNIQENPSQASNAADASSTSSSRRTDSTDEFVDVVNDESAKKRKTGSIPSECSAPGCTSAFKSQAELHRHLSAEHPGFKGFSCDRCTHAYRSPHALRFHKRNSHSDPKPFEMKKEFSCPHCGNKFGRKTTLRSHMQDCQVNSP